MAHGHAVLLSLEVIGLQAIAGDASHKQAIDILSATPFDTRIVDTVTIPSVTWRVVYIEYAKW